MVVAPNSRGLQEQSNSSERSWQLLMPSHRLSAGIQTPVPQRKFEGGLQSGEEEGGVVVEEVWVVLSVRGGDGPKYQASIKLHKTAIFVGAHTNSQAYNTLKFNHVQNYMNNAVVTICGKQNSNQCARKKKFAKLSQSKKFLRCTWKCSDYISWHQNFRMGCKTIKS